MVRHDLVLHPIDAADGVELFRIDGDEVTVGRGRGCTHRLDHESISSRHLALRRDARGWTATDLGSRNGTWLDEMLVAPDEPTPVTDGALLGVGAWTFRVEVIGAAPQTATIEIVRGAGRTLVTRATMFVRLRHDDTIVRELAWEEFAAKYRPVILAATARVGVSVADGDDIVQEVMQAFLGKSRSFRYDPAGRFRALLKTMTRAAIADFARKESAERRRAIEHVLRSRTLDDAWDRAWGRHLVGRAMAAVRPHVRDDHWEAFRLSACEGRTAAEVAGGLGLQVAAVEKAVVRTRNRVRETLERMRSVEG